MRARLALVFSLSTAVAACIFGEPQSEEVASEKSEAALAACVAGARPTTGYGLAPAFGDVTFASPVGLINSPVNNDTFYVIERKGVLKRVVRSGASATATVFADLRTSIQAGPGEAGLLGFALHPKFNDNGLVYLSYTKSVGQQLISVISRAKTNDGGATLDPSSVAELLTINQPYSNHNGGNIAFGPDGFLYAGFGDGGSGGDPQGNGLNKNTLLGKMLRIDVDSGSPYAIPQDNPFRNGGGKPEIYAYGLRNPWRWSFDTLTGELWAGDVGQGKWEEVDKVVLGGNYGWGKREGAHCFNQSPCDIPGAIEPVAEYGRGDGYSITGGFVYRGTALPDLYGHFIYGDYGSGKVWALDTVADAPTPKLIMQSGANISSFGQDNAGEVYIVNYAGKVLRIVAAQAEGGVPDKLSLTGCFNASNPTVPSPKLVPYDVNSPLWSDGAEKHRWMSLPQGAKIKVGADGDWDLPVGSVLVKEFRLGGKRVETRLFMRHTDGVWAGYTYEWNDAQTEATLLADGKTKQVGGQTWTYPSRSQCGNCHTGAAGGSLGLETAQLNKVITYPDGTSQNQLAKLTALGAFDPATPIPSTASALPSPADENASPEARARSYLHSNCAHCHRPGSTGRGVADLRFANSFAQTRLCNSVPETGTLGVADAKILVPGTPEKSVLSLRMHASDMNRMPPLAVSITDDVGVNVVDEWIKSIEECP